MSIQINKSTHNLSYGDRHIKINYLQLQTSYFRAVISELGATLLELHTPDRSGKLADVLVGYQDQNLYLKPDCYFGTTIGRCANRIARGQFKLNQRAYQLDINNAENHLHGGLNGYSQQIFTSAVNSDSSVTLTYIDAADDSNLNIAGYPGTVRVSVTYSCPSEQELKIDFHAITDTETLINLTNHAYFNLNPPSQSALEQLLAINSDTYLPVNDKLIPTGEIRSVENTKFDFRYLTAIASHLDENDEQQQLVGDGIDHNYLLRGGDNELAAILHSEHSGRTIEIQTDLPGLQLYTANFPPSDYDKLGRPFVAHDAICLEPQYFPDAINQTIFQAPIFSPHKPYRHHIKYLLSTK